MNGFEIAIQPGQETPQLLEINNVSSYPSDDWFFESYPGGRSDSGIRVSPLTSLTHGPVWHAVNILSGDVGQLPLEVMKQEGRRRRVDVMHPVNWLLNAEPNNTTNPSIWKETMMSWALLWGNACCYIERDATGRPSALIPLLPDRTRPRAVEYMPQTGEQFYFVTIESQINGKLVQFLYDDIFHIRGLTMDGFWGISAVETCKNTIGHGLGLEKHGNKLFANSAIPAGVVRHPAQMSPEARANFRKEWYAVHGGLDNTGKVAVLWDGMQFDPMSMTSEDAQWMEDREFDRQMIASIFQLPAFKLNSLENSAVRANLEEQNRDYFNTSLSRHLTKFREEGERKLITTNERRPSPVRGRTYLKWDTSAFLKGDTKSRYESYSIGITGRFLSPNEAREKEDMNPYPGGDEFLNPAIDKAGDDLEKKDKEKPEDDSEEDDKKETAALFLGKQVRTLLNREKTALRRAVGNSPVKNFPEWVVKYYENYPEMAREYLEVPAKIVGGVYWGAVIAEHAEDSLSELLQLAGEVTKEGLPSAVKDYAKTLTGMEAKLLGEMR